MAGGYNPDDPIRPGHPMTNQDVINDMWEDQDKMVSQRGMAPGGVWKTYPPKMPTHGTSMTWHAKGGMVPSRTDHVNKSYRSSPGRPVRSSIDPNADNTSAVGAGPTGGV